MADLHRATVEWVQSELDAEVAGVEPLLGGVSAIVARCDLADGRRIVVRHITDTGWLGREPYLIDSEATAMLLFADGTLPLPTLLAHQPIEGRLAMSLLAGQPNLEPGHLRRHVEEMAEVAATIATTDTDRVADLGRPPLPRWRTWASARPRPPDGPGGDIWRRVIDRQRRTEPPPGPDALIHRDLHPGNLLWEGDRLTGVIDWVNACVGHPHAEPAHTRFNLSILVGVDLADAFLDRYLTLTDSGPYDHWWDRETALSTLTGETALSTLTGEADQPDAAEAWHALGRRDLTTGVIAERTEAFLASTLR